MITEEKINANYLRFINRLESYNCYSEQMIQDLGEKIKYGSYSMSDDHGGCYTGSLVDVTLNILCRIAYEINEKALGTNGGQNPSVAHPYLAVNINKLMRVLLLLNVAKAEMYVEETEDWKKKKGQMYRFYDSDSMLNTGQRTLYLCQKYGITLDEDEYEAIMSADDKEDNAVRFRTPLYALVRTAKFLTLIELKRKWMAEHSTTPSTVEK